MRFEIIKTSDRYEFPEDPPCEGAEVGKLIGFYDTIKGKKGKEVDTWFIEVKSLNDLMKIPKKSDIIITESIIDYKTPCIEIYDDYRE